MKTFAFLLLLAAPVLAHATDLHPGDSLADVQAALGAPTGQAQMGNNLTLFYDRGRVQLVNGKLTSSNLLSPKEFAAQQAQQKAATARAAQRIAEGEALKAKTIADPNFASAPSAYQLSFWKNFRLRYPEVSCDDEYKLAFARSQDEIAAQERGQKIADLETRVADAENRAAIAESDARLANSNTSLSEPFFNEDAPHDQFRAHEHDDDNRAPQTGPASIPTASTPRSSGLILSPSAAGLTPPPSATGLTPPPSTGM